MTQNLIVFTGAPTLPSHDHPRPERLASRANPLRTTWSHFAPAGVSAGLFLFKLLIRGAIGGAHCLFFRHTGTAHDDRAD